MATKPQIERREKVLLELKHKPGGTTTRYLSELVGHHYTTTNDDLHVLMHEGKVSHDNGHPRVWKVTR